jgi:2-C-methyl-D-erythritol 4-phosphate cytidylyltransferase / 2-C-methyl-D-erythritol 2,4-cyclodiphosphate synthase
VRRSAAGVTLSSVPSCTALIVAAGRGIRFGGPLPKQYAAFNGTSVLALTVSAFLSVPGITAIRVVIAPQDRDIYAAGVEGLDLPPPVLGGATRQQSVLNGLEALATAAPDFVAIHDAARPFILPHDISACLAAAAAPGIDGAILGIALTDTLKRVDTGTIAATIPRAGLWRAQTPQVFRYGRILAAHRAAATLGATETTALTDDAAVAERAGHKIVMVSGSGENRKVTTVGDLQQAQTMETRTAFGFDVHGFVPGKGVTLGGVAIAHNHALGGHSDADVALHALTDAVLGAIGAGDIGQHFPPSDERWRGASSDRFLHHAVELVRARQGRIVHLDLTIVCEAPRIGPHREALVTSIARIAGIASSRVSVKATTTEGLGYTGRREGIAAHGVATVELPRQE